MKSVLRKINRGQPRYAGLGAAGSAGASSSIFSRGAEKADDEMSLDGWAYDAPDLTARAAAADTSFLPATTAPGPR